MHVHVFTRKRPDRKFYNRFLVITKCKDSDVHYGWTDAKMKKIYLIVFIYLIICPGLSLSVNIVTIIDKVKEESSPLLKSTIENQKLLDGWSGQMKVVLSNENSSIKALDEVCSFTEEGTVAMVDISSPTVGQLLRSFARAAGMAYITIMDQSTLLPVDLNPDLHLSVEPPGSAMLKIISDIVKFEQLTKIAILYDTSFGQSASSVGRTGTRISCTLCKVEASIISISGNPSFKAKAEYVRFIQQDNRFFLTSDITIDDAFIYDVVKMISHVIQIAQPNKPIYVNNCYGVTNASTEIVEQSRRFINTFRKIGNWTEEQGLRLIKGASLIKTQGQKRYRVVVYPEYPPFVYKKYNATGGVVYEGYCLDLLEQIANITGFTYDLYPSPDNLAGAMADDGSWSGVINELIQKRADIAVGPISVMAERENVVDFTVPYYDLVGLTILMKKPKFDYWIFKFVDVLEPEVWGGIIAAYFLFSGLLWIFDRSSPFSYQNNRSAWNGQGAEPRIFTFKEGVWFCMMSLTPQGGGEAPRALSGRLVAATWWLFGFIIIATYTANLAAFLTVSRMETTIKSLDDLIWKKMSLNDSLDPVERAKLAVWDYPVSNRYSKLWETMNNSKFPDNLSEAITRVRTNGFAYIGDAEENRYQTLTKCDLMEVGEQFSRKPFAFAVQDGSPLRAQLSNAILQLLNQRALEQLKAKWWTKNENRKDCPKVENESEGISIQHIGGVFLVIAFGTVLAFISLGFEYYWYKYRPVKESKNYKVEKSMSRAKLATTSTSTASLQDLPNGDIPTWQNVTVEFPRKQQNGHSNVGFDLGERL
ncbi:hypothetical protein KUTeg_005243 [Tegillarca granosa]|uniref:Uncharacterized protein n=1 Tax=Tegillarca granosa TaxID=220873 RepID=A0ABQ9FJ78_TEGGR|nr:hypothetical protein KUTeg_005243 [Tegillarca granosa]